MQILPVYRDPGSLPDTRVRLGRYAQHGEPVYPVPGTREWPSGHRLQDKRGSGRRRRRDAKRNRRCLRRDGKPSRPTAAAESEQDVGRYIDIRWRLLWDNAERSVGSAGVSGDRAIHRGEKEFLAKAKISLYFALKLTHCIGMTTTMTLENLTLQQIICLANSHDIDAAQFGARAAKLIQIASINRNNDEDLRWMRNADEVLRKNLANAAFVAHLHAVEPKLFGKEVA
jgi:hypothetical protein